MNAFVIKTDRMPLRLAYLFIAFFGCAVGISFIVKANLGVDPWNMFYLGMVEQFGLSMGVWIMIVCTLLTIASWLLGTKPFIATIMDILIFGMMVDVANKYNFFPEPTSFIISLLYMSMGMVVLAISVGVYLNTSIGAGPHMLIVIAFVNRTGKSMGLIKTISDVMVLVLGFIMGGQSGVGTVILALGMGYLFEFFTNNIRLKGLEESIS